MKCKNNPQCTPPIRPLHSEKCAIFSRGAGLQKKAELLMFLIFLASLTYFWLWLETARPPVCEMQSCDTTVIWVMELCLVFNRVKKNTHKKHKKKYMCVATLVFNGECQRWIDKWQFGLF